MKTQELPETDSIDELARFWDTHDLTDFEDRLEELPERIFRRRPKPGVGASDGEGDEEPKGS